MNASLPKLQHYVPQFLLRRFAVGEGKRKAKYRLWVYDKWEERSFPSTVEKIAAENGFYNLQVDDQLHTLELGLGRVEDQVAPIVARLETTRSLAALSTRDRELLAYFVAVQLLRTPQDRHSREKLGEDMRLLFEMWQVPTGLPPEYDPRLAARVESLDALSSDSHRHARILLSKTWVLFESPPEAPFWVSDHPVSMANHLQTDESRGNIGLAVRGIEIYLPLSTRLTLGLLCPALAGLFREAASRTESATRAMGVLPPGSEMPLEVHRNIVDGTPVALSAESVVHQNWLQIAGSYRFIYVKSRDFALVEDVLRQSPRMKRGPTPEFR